MKPLTLDVINQLDYTKCLRPQATRFLLEDMLITGKSINLIGKAGQGRKRTCEDLARLAAPFCKVWMTDIKMHRNSYANLAREMAEQLGTEGDFSRIDEVMDQVNSDRPLLIIFEHLSYIADDHPSSQKESIDPLYDKHFVSFLNNLKNNKTPKVYLLIPSEQVWKNIKVDGQYSTLELESEELRPIAKEEIRQEVNRQLSPEWNKHFVQQSGNFSLLTETIHQHELPYYLLLSLCTRLQRGEHDTLPFPKRLKAHTKAFDRQHQYSFERKLVGYRKFTTRHLRASGLSLPNAKGILDFFNKLLGR